MRLSDRRNADLDEPYSSCPGLVLATDHVQYADEIIQREQHVPYRELLTAAQKQWRNSQHNNTAMGIQKSVLGLFHNIWHQNKTEEASCFWGASSVRWMGVTCFHEARCGETWIHNFPPDVKHQSLEWDHMPFPCSKKLKTAPSAGKVIWYIY
jgi:hypothetical protein